MAITEQVNAQLDKLARLETGPFPVVSLYLNMQPDQRGRDNFEPFLRKELTDRVRTYGAEGPEQKSLEEDADKIRKYVETVDPSVNGLAIFASSGAELFETLELAAPITEHRLYVADQPHLYPLARLLDEYPTYVVLIADTHDARLLVVAGNAVQHKAEVAGTKIARPKVSGWSQARYQRHAEHYHLQHAKEVVDRLTRLVRDENIQSVIIAGDEVIVPLLTEQLPKDIAERVTDVLKLDVNAPEREMLEATLAAVRSKDAETDRERVEALLNAYRGNGLGVVGVEATAAAFEMGQVDELIITAAPERLDTVKAAISPGTSSTDATEAEDRTARELVAKAHQTSASIRFIQDASLLEPVGGVGAFLRFKLS